MKHFVQRYKTSAQRLYVYRQRAADSKHGFTDWRQHRYEKGCLFTGQKIHRNPNKPEKWFTDDKDQIGTYLGDAHAVGNGIRNLGYYTDVHCYDTCIGGVARLRTSRGTWYIPVTYRTDCDGSTHWLNHTEVVDRGARAEDHETAIFRAARAADRLSEAEAEDAREDDAKYRADQDICDARARIHELNADALPVLRDLRERSAALTPVSRKALLRCVTQALEARAEQFAVIKARADDYWSAVAS